MPDGKFICFTPSAGLYEGTQTERIFRIEADGALDTTFHAPHIQYGFVNTFYPLASGKVLVGGWFKVNAFADTLSWMRLLPDGQIDMTFNNQMSFQVHNAPINIDPSVMDFLLIDSDKMAITGAFDELAGVTHGGIAMVDTAGNLLDGYFLGNGCSSFIGPEPGSVDDGMVLVGISPAPDGSYYIYGQYRGYDDGTTNDHATRLCKPPIWL
ncbi:MAG: delta-60 repeat domain-containing protein [Flavobacteriales bacterium]|nr:delta-60 repeat domain-containing protein [Flavobacteriales bacterium]